MEYMDQLRKDSTDRAKKRQFANDLNKQITENNMLKEKERIYLNDKCLATNKQLLATLNPMLFKKRNEVVNGDNSPNNHTAMNEDDQHLD